jgi:DNA (cytosine-5)-methyltransferase 1
VDDGLPRRMDGTTISASKHRKDRLKACGNAIVPQVAMQIFEAIK